MKKIIKQNKIIKKITINILIIIFLINLSGCATVVLGTGGRNRWNKVYPATGANCQVFFDSCSKQGIPFMFGYIDGWARVPFFLLNTIDLPFSITSDTLLLPVDIYRWNFPKKLNDTKQNQTQEELKDDKQEKNKNEK